MLKKYQTYGFSLKSRIMSRATCLYVNSDRSGSFVPRDGIIEPCAHNAFSLLIPNNGAIEMRNTFSTMGAGGASRSTDQRQSARLWTESWYKAARWSEPATLQSSARLYSRQDSTGGQSKHLHLWTGRGKTSDTSTSNSLSLVLGSADNTNGKDEERALIGFTGCK